MIKVRLKGKDVTIKKVEVSLDENIKDILLDYVGRLKVDSLIEGLRNAIEGRQMVIVWVDEECSELILNKGSRGRYIPILAEYSLSQEIFDNYLTKFGISRSEAEKFVHLLYSLKEVPDESNEETEETSQGEAEAETSET